MNFGILIGILITLALVIGVSLLSARKATDADSFTTAGGKGNALMVTGIIMTSLVGGQSTVGTAQLAFAYGISAWWFTIGAALGCLLLAIGYGKALRQSGCSTLLQVVGQAYGPRAETTGSILCFIGIFISIVAQILAASALLSGLFHLNALLSAFISVALMMLMVVLGGVWGAGYSGLLKALLLYLSALFAGLLVLTLAGGYDTLQQSIVENTTGQPYSGQLQLHDAEEVHRRFNNLVARGWMKDIGGGLSLMLGVVATQTYAQGIWAARSNRVALHGGLLCAFLTPLIGAGCTLVGLYMRAHYVTAEEMQAVAAAHASLPAGVRVLQNTAEAFPVFCLEHMPALLAGIVLGTLLLTIIGGGSGLALGSATILVRDVFGNLKAKWQQLTGARCRGHAYRLTDESPALANESPALADESPALADESPAAADGSPYSADGSPALATSSPAAADSLPSPAKYKPTLKELRLTIVGILLLGILFSLTSGRALINDLGFLSLGLRATAVLLPLTAALFFPRRFKASYVLASMVAGTAMLLVAQLISLPGAPIYWGLGIGLAVCLAGRVKTNSIRP